MKLLVMCEGQNEKKLLDILLENDCLKFNESDLLGRNTFHARQIASSGQVKIYLNLYHEEVEVIRVGDKQSDKLVIPKEYKDKIKKEIKICTKPELEMLLIIACNLVDDYNKYKSGKDSVSAKEYAKKMIKNGKKSYDNSTAFWDDFFSSNVSLLVNSIKEYKRIHGKTHGKDEGCLADLLA